MLIKLSSLEHLDDIYEHISNNSSLVLATFVNAFSYYDLTDKMVDQIDYFFSDGIFLTKLNNSFNKEKVNRISFDSTSMAYSFFDYCCTNKLRVGLVGATSEEISNFSCFIQTKYPELCLNLVSPGFFAEGEKEVVVEQALSCDVVIIGMGFPYQENFLLRLKEQHVSGDRLRFAITCGGFFTQHQSRDYYPKLIDRLELRWFYRLLFTSHVRKKFFSKYPQFFIRYIYNALF